uniref:SER_THR_PHOSPHATASE domain-containing protein n=1 Tax=Globodera pallida TaxID=36090 RepID=A0A183CRY4_GLOPA
VYVFGMPLRHPQPYDPKELGMEQACSEKFMEFCGRFASTGQVFRGPGNKIFEKPRCSGIFGVQPTPALLWIRGCHNVAVIMSHNFLHAEHWC